MSRSPSIRYSINTYYTNYHSLPSVTGQLGFSGVISQTGQAELKGKMSYPTLSSWEPAYRRADFSRPISLYTADIPLQTRHTATALYADDTLLMMASESPILAEINSNLAFAELEAWLKKKMENYG